MRGILTPFLADGAVERVKRGSWGSSARGFVVSPQAPAAGKKPGRVPDQDKNTGTPRQKVATRCGEGGGGSTPIPCALGVPRVPPPPSRVRPLSSRLPGRRGCAAHRTPTHWLRSELRLLRPLSAPAGRQRASFVRARAVPLGVLPGLPNPDSPPPGASRPRADAGGRKTPTRVLGGECAAEKQRVGDVACRGLGNEGTGARWRAGEASGLRYANSREDRASPLPNRAPNPPGHPEVAGVRASGSGVPGWGTGLGYRVMLGRCIPGGWQTGTRGRSHLAGKGSPNAACMCPNPTSPWN